MDINAAKAAQPLVVQIEKLQTTIAAIDMALAEKWCIVQLKVAAPAEGASSPEGTLLDLLPFGGKASAENSVAALERAKATYVAVLGELTSQLAGL